MQEPFPSASDLSSEELATVKLFQDNTYVSASLPASALSQCSIPGGGLNLRCGHGITCQLLLPGAVHSMGFEVKCVLEFH